MPELFYDPNQPRDERGRFGSSGFTPAATLEEAQAWAKENGSSLKGITDLKMANAINEATSIAVQAGAKPLQFEYIGKGQTLMRQSYDTVAIQGAATANGWNRGLRGNPEYSVSANVDNPVRAVILHEYGHSIAGGSQNTEGYAARREFENSFYGGTFQNNSEALPGYAGGQYGARVEREAWAEAYASQGNPAAWKWPAEITEIMGRYPNVFTEYPRPTDNHAAPRSRISAARAQVARVIAAIAEHYAARGVDVDEFISVPDGIMIAFYPSPELAQKIAIPGGEPPQDLHITLALPGKLSSLSPEMRRRLPQIVRGFGLISRPLAGTFSGVTEFPAHEGVKPVVLLVDIPGLPAWRQRLVEVLALNGYTVASDHGFVPHMTVKYAPEKETVAVDVPTGPIAFDRVCLMMGDRKKEYPLGGNPEVDDVLDAFAADNRRRAVHRKQRKEVVAVERYQRVLVSDFDSWADDLAAQIAEDPSNADELIAAALLALLLLLRRRGSEHLPDAVTLGLERAGGVGTAAIYQRLAAAIARNDEYLTTSLLPAIGERLRALVAGADYAAALAGGADGVRALVLGVLGAVSGRVGSYSGDWWRLFNAVSADVARFNNNSVVAHLDPAAHDSHCDQCPMFHDEGGREYESIDAYLQASSGRLPGDYSCQNRCRCWIEVVQNDGERQTIVP